MVSKSHEMEVFSRVVALGSFSAAALELGITPSGVSRVVSRIEDRLGVRLLARSTRKLALTSEGETYLARARDILQAIEDAEMETAQRGTGPSGLLRINTGPTFARYKLMHVLPEFVWKYPKIDLRLGISDQLVDLAANQVDVAVRAGKLVDSDLVARKLLDAPRVICASPDYLDRFGIPQSPQDLKSHRCLLISGVQTLSKWPFHNAQGPFSVQINPSAASDSADLMRDMALAGLGIARIVRFSVESEIARGDLVPLLEEEHSTEAVPFSAVMLPERQRDPRVRAFVDHLVTSIGAHGQSHLANSAE